MNAFAENRVEIKVYHQSKRLYAKLQGWGFSGDNILFIFILAGLNSHQLGGGRANLQVFLPAALAFGEWGGCSAIPLFI